MNGYLAKPIDRRAFAHLLCHPQAAETPMPAPAPAETDVDTEVVEDIIETFGMDALLTLRDRLGTSGDGELAALEDAAARQDATALARGAHAFKSAVGSLGLRATQNLATTIEDRARAGDVAAASAGARDLRAAFDRGMAVLDDLIDGASEDCDQEADTG